MAPAAPVPHVTRPVQARSRGGRLAERLIAPFVAPFAVLAAGLLLLATRLQATTVGVNVLTGSRPGPQNRVLTPGGTYFVVGLTDRGPSAGDPIEVRSMADFVDRFGSRVSYGAVYDDLEVYFAEGGARAYVARVVGAAATSGTLALKDRSGGGGLNTVTVTARGAGAWSSRLTVQVADGVIANTFSVFLRLDGNLVEQYLDLATPGDLVAALNNRSTYLTAVDNAAATAPPNNNPVVLAATALSAGNDDRAAVNAAAYVAALARFAPGLGSGAVAIPGQPSSGVGAGLVAHAAANRRIALLAVATGSTPGQAKTAAGALRGATGRHAGLFYPWINTPDGAGGVRTISPEGYIAAMRARAHRESGPWRAPAGEIARAGFVTGLAYPVSAAELDDLAANRVNSIVVRAGSIRNYGWRSLSTDVLNFTTLSGADVINAMADEAEAVLEQYVFAPIDDKGQLLSGVEGALTGICERYRNAGGLYGRLDGDGFTVLDPGYLVDVGPTVNTPATLAANEVRANVSIRVSPTAELITLEIVKVAFDTAL